MSNRRVAYLVMDDMGDFVTDFHLSFEPMAALGWQVSTVPWRSRPDWNEFDAVYICVPWDYPSCVDEFLETLQVIDASSAVLLNDLSIVRWNLDKSYLEDLAANGDDIVPSCWYDGFDVNAVAGFFATHGAEKVVIKPTVGGSAKDTFVLTDPVPGEMLEYLAECFANRSFFVQPFVAAIQGEGEYSLFFFNGEYSHAVVKMPGPGDFRVQEEHGAEINPISPPNALLKVAQHVFSYIDPLPVYGRGDWVRGPDGRFLLMELELIEPSLYLRTDPSAALRFARAFDHRFRELTGT